MLVHPSSIIADPYTRIIDYTFLMAKVIYFFLSPLNINDLVWFTSFTALISIHMDVVLVFSI